MQSSSKPRAVGLGSYAAADLPGKPAAEAVAPSTPLVSVVMTTYREDRSRLGRAVDSILDQTLGELEFIVVFEEDDANCQWLRSQYHDPRLVMVQLSGERGRVACHNKGMSLVRGRYVARMDGDDVSYPYRLERQVAYLRAHPEIGVLGSAGRLVDRQGHGVGVRQFPTSHEGIVRSMALTNPIFHPSVMWDRERAGADLRYAFHVDDFELWLRLVGKGVRFANLSESLIDYTQPENYRRPMRDWRGNFEVRLHHWRLVLRYPRMAAGIIGFGLISILPQRVVDLLTRRNWVTDRIRSIRSQIDDTPGRV